MQYIPLCMVFPFWYFSFREKRINFNHNWSRIWNNIHSGMFYIYLDKQSINLQVWNLTFDMAIQFPNSILKIIILMEETYFRMFHYYKRLMKIWYQKNPLDFIPFLDSYEDLVLRKRFKYTGIQWMYRLQLNS